MDRQPAGQSGPHAQDLSGHPLTGFQATCCWCFRTLALQCNQVIVPPVRPLETIGINYREKEVLEQPDVCRVVVIETVAGFELYEKVVPVIHATSRSLDPHVFSSSIVHRSIKVQCNRIDCHKNGELHLLHRYGLVRTPR